MSTQVVIYTKDDYTYHMLSYRFADFPDFYYAKGPSDGSRYHHNNFVEDTIIVYDGRYFTRDQLIRNGAMEPTWASFCIMGKDPSKANSTKKLTRVNCKKLYEAFKEKAGTNIREECFEKTDSMISRGVICTVVSFADIPSREDFIKTIALDLKQEFCLRLDLMPGVRMPEGVYTSLNNSGSISSLLKLAKDNELTSSAIIEHSNPTFDGFLSPGRPTSSDEIIDAEISTLVNLIDKASDLSYNDDPIMNVLFVIEGFKFNQLKELLQRSSNVLFLIPEYLYNEVTGFKDEINDLIASLPGIVHTDVIYSDNYNRVMVNEQSFA